MTIPKPQWCVCALSRETHHRGASPWTLWGPYAASSCANRRVTLGSRPLESCDLYSFLCFSVRNHSPTGRGRGDNTVHPYFLPIICLPPLDKPLRNRCHSHHQSQFKVAESNLIQCKIYRIVSNFDIHMWFSIRYLQSIEFFDTIRYGQKRAIFSKFDIEISCSSSVNCIVGYGFVNLPSVDPGVWLRAELLSTFPVQMCNRYNECRPQSINYGLQRRFSIEDFWKIFMICCYGVTNTSVKDQD